jgi:flagellar biosynthesis protein FlhB
MADEGGEKTEEPTHKKLQDARKKGQVWKSKDFSGVMVFCIGLGVVKATFPTLRCSRAPSPAGWRTSSRSGRSSAWR